MHIIWPVHADLHSGRVSSTAAAEKRIDPTWTSTATNVSNGVTYMLNVGGLCRRAGDYTEQHT